MMAKLGEIIQKITEMNAEELEVVHDVVLNMLNAPLNNRNLNLCYEANIWDDWNDVEVDKVYEEMYHQLR